MNRSGEMAAARATTSYEWLAAVGYAVFLPNPRRGQGHGHDLAAVELFEFDYQLEMYKPAAKRRWGHFALPILYNDRLVGKLDAAADHHGVLRVDAVHQDVPFTKAMTAAVDREIEDLARWLELDLKLPG